MQKNMYFPGVWVEHREKNNLCMVSHSRESGKVGSMEKLSNLLLFRYPIYLAQNWF